MTANDQQTTRRTVLCGAAAASAAGLGLTACSAASGEAPASGPATPTAPVSLGSAEEIPVGGAMLFREDKVLVSQAEQGAYKAFSAVCTHGGCVLTSVETLEADCSCHGSRFDAATGEVLRGPATVALPEVPVTVDGGKLVAGPPA